MVDVSVVVPFFNPGANIDDCLDSLVAQTLPHDRYEIVLVDDGSTDGSDRRVAEYAERWPELIRVTRIEATGWPGRPRNTGIDASRGTYVQFVDSDDTMHRGALERLLEVALASDADVVVGKLTSDFRGLHHPVFRKNVTGRTLYDYPLVETLTPHKMVRRRLLVDNGIRFAEGPRHVEDEHFSMQVYTHAKSVAVVGDLPCYFYRRRRVSGRNLGDVEMVPSEYYRDLAHVLDVIDASVEDPEARIPIQRRFYRNEMLGRLRGKAMRGYEDRYRREVLEQVRALATTRFDPRVRSGLPFFIRTQSRMMLDGAVTLLTGYAAWLESIRLHATCYSAAWREGKLHIELDGVLHAGDRPLHLEPDGDSWLVPSTAAPSVDAADRLVTPADLAAVDLDCATVSRSDAQVWSTTEGLSLSITETGTIEVAGEVVIDPATVHGGTVLDPGLWDLRLRVMVGGLTRVAALRPPSETEPEPVDAWVVDAPDGSQVVAPYWTFPSPSLALDVAEWSHPLVDLLDGAPEPELRRRRLSVAIPALRGKSGSLEAALILEPSDAEFPNAQEAAAIELSPEGSRFVAKLPRRLPGGSHWRIWLRLGPPGGAPARTIGRELVRDGRAVRLEPINRSG
ncbi:MAG TPA: glycosyltransferase family 2 protein [Mycobacteriales bacterium]|nr:glycosyltransferase family 2 protein [Mycobacteriales bacterium]